MKLLGTHCIGCGHEDIRVLEFDHINDDGAADRKRFGGARTMLLYFLEHPDEARQRLQLLCRNCNWLKRRGDPLPHDANPARDALTHSGPHAPALQALF